MQSFEVLFSLEFLFRVVTIKQRFLLFPHYYFAVQPECDPLSTCLNFVKDISRYFIDWSLHRIWLFTRRKLKNVYCCVLCVEALFWLSITTRLCKYSKCEIKYLLTSIWERKLLARRYLKDSLLQHDETIVSSAGNKEQQWLGSGGTKFEGYIGATLSILEG